MKVREVDLVRVIGWDIGGANTKAVYINTKETAVYAFKVATEYFPFWKDAKALDATLLRIRKQLSGEEAMDGVGVTTTAELSDAYRTKREGVNHILECCRQAFASVPIYVLTVNAKLETLDLAIDTPFEVAAANWAATGWLASQYMRDCIVVDVGSTSTSIIPVIDGKVAASGKTDLEKLINGELVYTGSLRTNVATIVHSIPLPLRGGVSRVSSELFAQSGDVHLILGNITSEDYSVETADCKGKTREETLARLARVVCADTETLTEQELVEIAKYIFNQQLEQIQKGLSQVYERTKLHAKSEVTVVTAGLGGNFLARIAAERVGIQRIVGLSALVPEAVAKMAPAGSVALMTASKVTGRQVKWMR